MSFAGDMYRKIFRRKNKNHQYIHTEFHKEKQLSEAEERRAENRATTTGKIIRRIDFVLIIMYGVCFSFFFAQTSFCLFVYLFLMYVCVCMPYTVWETIKFGYVYFIKCVRACTCMFKPSINRSIYYTSIYRILFIFCVCVIIFVLFCLYFVFCCCYYFESFNHVIFYKCWFIYAQTKGRQQFYK